MQYPDPPVPPGVDPEVASVARVYDYYLGGRYNYPSDRAAAEGLRKVLPELREVAWANRAFHQRAAHYLAAECGIRQFIDIGCGLPTQNNTHDVVWAVDGNTRVAYVDNDPVVTAHAGLLITDSPRAVFIQGEMRDPAAILGHPQLLKITDPLKPVGLLMTAVWQFIADDENPSPWELMRQYTAWLAPGSYVAISHVTGDQKPPLALETCREIYRERAKMPIYPRTLAEVTFLFSDLEVIPPYEGAPPGVVHVGLWGAEDPSHDDDPSSWMYAAVARVP